MHFRRCLCGYLLGNFVPNTQQRLAGYTQGKPLYYHWLLSIFQQQNLFGTDRHILGQGIVFFLTGEFPPQSTCSLTEKNYISFKRPVVCIFHRYSHSVFISCLGRIKFMSPYAYIIYFIVHFFFCGKRYTPIEGSDFMIAAFLSSGNIFTAGQHGCLDSAGIIKKIFHRRQCYFLPAALMISLARKGYRLPSYL